MTARARGDVLTAADEGVKLTRSLGRIDLIFFTVGATFALDSIAQIAATGGAESFTWGLVVAVTFLVPYAFITAELGSYNYNTQQVAVDSEVKVVAADGYRMNTRGVSVDLDKKTMVGSGGVEGATPAGTFSADSMQADLNARTVALQGRARLHMIPGKMQVPH